MTGSKGFGSPAIPVRIFEVEYKHRPPEDKTGEFELLVKTTRIEVPDLKNREWEKRWAIVSVWNFLNKPEAKELNINQAFIFTKDFTDLIIRVELNEFFDEKPETLNPPDETSYAQWIAEVKTRFKQLYNIRIDEWLNTNKQRV